MVTIIVLDQRILYLEVLLSVGKLLFVAIATDSEEIISKYIAPTLASREVFFKILFSFPSAQRG